MELFLLSCRSKRGLIPHIVREVSGDAIKGVGLKELSSTVASTAETSWISRRWPLTKKLAFFVANGPLRLYSHTRFSYDGLSAENGLREFNAASLKMVPAPPCHLPVPGLVRISMRPKPIRSYSDENGFWLMMTSPMLCLSGS